MIGAGRGKGSVRLVTPQAAADNGWLAVADLAEVVEGQALAADAGGHPVVLVRLGGVVHALDGRCPHRGGPMTEGKVEGKTIRCPWHGFRFDVASGEVVWPAGWDALLAYSTRVRDGRVEVAVSSLGMEHDGKR